MQIVELIGRCSLSLLNYALRSDPSRWTFVVPNGNGRSVVDLALTRGLDSARLSVVDAPISTAHRMLVVASDHVVLERVDPKRYSWARRMFADPDDRPALSVLLAPAYNYLRALWMDATLDFDDIADHPTAALQDAVDSLYRHTTDVLRAVLEDIACWPSSRSKRGRTATMRPDWQALQRCDLRFYLSSMRRVFAATSQLQPSQRPSIEEFADHWKAVFEKPGVDDGPRLRCPRLSTDLDDEERHAFGPAVVTAIIKRHEWMKGVGPDNIPMDLLKRDPDAAGPWISCMFTCLYTVQLVPSDWRSALVVPVHKRNTEPADPLNWRGIALQSHLRKAYETCLITHMHLKGWLQMHFLQFGFRRGIGVPEAVWVADELTTHWASRRKPLTEVLLDMRKAYDSARRIHVYNKLQRRGVPAHVIAVLQALFDGCHFIIALDGQLSERIAALVGLFQGAIGSPDHLFNVLIDDLPYQIVSRFGDEGPMFDHMPVPCQFYADDTLLHAFTDQMAQAMMDLCQEYAQRHELEWNATKWIVSRPRTSTAAQPAALTIGGNRVVEEHELDKPVCFLGAVMKDGRLDHRAQLASRTARAEKAMIGIMHSGVFSTKHLSIVRKTRVVGAWIRSRAEYGLAISNSHVGLLKKLDQLQKSAAALFFGGYRRRIGSSLMLRYAGPVPAAARQAKLRARFAFKQITWSEQIKDGDRVPYLVRVTRWALNNPRSRFNMMLKGCKVYADATAIYKNGEQARAIRNSDELADVEAGRPTRKRPRLPDRQDALLQALELHTWTAANATCKLMRLQMQPYNLPFPAAYHSGDDAYAVASWITNRIPGSSAQCRGCNDRNLSRYHMSERCTDSTRLLRPVSDWRIRALHFNRADTGIAIDYVAIQLKYDYARLTAPPASEADRLRPRRMPDPRDPTFRLSDRQRRWLAILGTFIHAVAARCIRGEPLPISAQGDAALPGLDATLWNEISDDR